MKLLRALRSPKPRWCNFKLTRVRTKAPSGYKRHGWEQDQMRRDMRPGGEAEEAADIFLWG